MSWELTAKWKPEYVEQGHQLAKLGLSDAQICKVWGISDSTIDHWKHSREGFFEALYSGRTIALGQVADSLFRAAVGYEYEEDAITAYKGEVVVTRVRKYKGPNPWAAAKILAIKDRLNWSEVQRSEHLTTNINIAKLDLTQLTPEQLKLLETIQTKQLTENAGHN
jgi:hypothetical protein